MFVETQSVGVNAGRGGVGRRGLRHGLECPLENRSRVGCAALGGGARGCAPSRASPRRCPSPRRRRGRRRSRTGRTRGCRSRARRRRRGRASPSREAARRAWPCRCASVRCSSRASTPSARRPGWAQRCRIPAFVELGRKVRRHREHILDTVRYGLSNARIEATNNKIKLLIRIAYGFRNIDAMIGLIMLFCSSIEIPRPGRTAQKPVK